MMVPRRCPNPPFPCFALPASQTLDVTYACARARCVFQQQTDTPSLHCSQAVTGAGRTLRPSLEQEELLCYEVMTLHRPSVWLVIPLSLYPTFCFPHLTHLSRPPRLNDIPTESPHFHLDNIISFLQQIHIGFHQMCICWRKKVWGGKEQLVIVKGLRQMKDS